MTQSEEICNNWLNDAKRDLIKNYRNLGLRASGNWEKDIETKQSQSGSLIKLIIRGSNYTDYLENGRRPNKNQNKEKLRAWVGWAGSTFLADWVKDKGIKINPFAVAYKIAREGWRVPNQHNAGGLVSDVITEKRINDLVKELGMAYINELKSEILKKWQSQA